MARTCTQVLNPVPLSGPTLCLALCAQLLASVIPTFTAHPEGEMILPTEQTEKLRLREVKSLAPGHLEPEL